MGTHSTIIAKLFEVCWNFFALKVYLFDSIEFTLWDVALVSIMIGLGCSLIGIFLDWRKS